jgi:tetratricopeptide (TPR) repeat protein
MDLTTAGRYELKSPIGRGGMATVYLAHDPRFRRDVAVKVMHDSLQDAEMLLRFEREAQTIAALEHPAIVPVYDYGEENGRPYLVMRYMSGGTLADRLGDGPLPVVRIVPVLERIGSALERAHTMGIIHRDLKPSNIMFDQYGDAFLGDFGIARLTEAAVTLTGQAVIGTPAYMSPEQVHGDKTLDGRSDIYALGVIVFEMLAGRQPYVDETPVKVMMKHVMDPVPTVRSVNPNLSTAYDDVIARTMAKNPDERFATAREVAKAMAAAAAQIETMPTSPPDKGQPVAADEATVALAPAFAKAPAMMAKGRRSPFVWLPLLAGGLLMLLLLFTAGAWLVYRSWPAAAVPIASRSEETGAATPSPPATMATATAAPAAGSAQAYATLARDRLDHGAFEEALVALDHAIELQPDNGEYYRQRADVYWLLGDMESALADADRVVAHGRNDASTYLFRARLLRDYGELDQALRDQTQALDIDRNYADAYFERGLTFLWQSEYAAALADLDRAVGLESGNAHYFVVRANVKRDMGSPQAAVADHLIAITLEPANAQYRAELGISYQWSGDFERALAEFDEAIRLEPHSAWFYSLRATLRREMGELDGSLVDFNQAIRREPEDAALYAGRALTYRAMDEPDAAVADLTRAIEMAPYESWFYIERGIIYRDSLEDLPAAEADFFQAIDLAPDDPYAYVHQAATFHQLNRLEEAIGLANRCLELAPEFPWCFVERGWAYAALDQPAKAVADLKRFLELVPAGECPECQSDARDFIADYP